MINADEVNFLCGRETAKEWKIKLDMEENKLEFKEQGKVVKLKESEGGHQLVNLEKVGKDFDVEDVNFLREEVDADVSESVIRKIHKILNHKSKEQMNYAYNNAGKMTPQVRKWIDRVVRTCKVCKKAKKSNSKPTVAIPRATDFNSVVAIDLKIMGDENILWMVCAFTKFIKGIVIKDKNPETIIKGIHEAWCLDVGYPTIGFWADNGGEFRNMKMEEFVSKLGIKIDFTPAYSPWSNGVNERNHYSCDIIVKKVMEDD